MSPQHPAPVGVSPMRRVAGLLAALVLLVPAGGCGYHLAGRATGSSFIPASIRTIGVPPFGNTTERPRLDQRISEALVAEFVQRGRFKALPDDRSADAILVGTIESYRQDPITFTPSGRYSRVAVTVTARIRLVQSAPEKVLWSQNHFVFREQYDLPESPSAASDVEIVALDLIARDFARQVVTTILEGF